MEKQEFFLKLHIKDEDDEKKADKDNDKDIDEDKDEDKDKEKDEDKKPSIRYEDMNILATKLTLDADGRLCIPEGAEAMAHNNRVYHPISKALEIFLSDIIRSVCWEIGCRRQMLTVSPIPLIFTRLRTAESFWERERIS